MRAEMDEHLHLTVRINVKGVEETEGRAREREREFGCFVRRKIVIEEEAKWHARGVHDHKRSVNISCFSSKTIIKMKTSPRRRIR